MGTSEQAVTRHRRALRRIERALSALKRGHTPDLVGIKFDVVFEDEDGNEIEGPVELDPDGWRVLLEAERDDLHAEIDSLTRFTPRHSCSMTPVHHHSGVVRSRTTPRPRERHAHRTTRSSSSSSSGDDSSGEPDLPDVARPGRVLHAARRRSR